MEEWFRQCEAYHNDVKASEKAGRRREDPEKELEYSEAAQQQRHEDLMERREELRKES